MLVGLSGPTITLSPGDEYPNCDRAEAIRLIDAGFAVPISEKSAECAVAARAPEKRRRKK